MSEGEKAAVKEIIAQRKDLNENQVRKLIAEKMKMGKGLLSFEGASRLVAEDLKVRTPGMTLGRTQIKSLVAGLNDASVSGRVLAADSPQTFRKKDGASGRVMRLTLVDRGGRITCVIWDNHVDMIEKIGSPIGRLVRIGHAYTRHGLGDRLELHVGERSSIEFEPADVPASDFPELSELFTEIGSIRADMEDANVVGVAQSEPRVSLFKKPDGEGRVLRTVIADESGMITVVAWNERAKDLEQLKIGDIVQLTNARVKLGRNNRRELHVERRSNPLILETPPPYLRVPVRKTHRVADLTPQVSQADMVVAIVAKGSIREIKRSSGEKGRVVDLIVGDETGLVSLSLWDEKAELIHQLEVGDQIDLHGVSVTERLGDLAISLGKYGELVKKEGRGADMPVTKLNSLETSKGLLIVEGAVADAPQIRQVTTGKGEVIDVGSFTVQDDTGSAKVTMWRKLAVEAAELKPGTKVRITGIRVQMGYNRQLELSSTPLTVMKAVTGEEKPPEPKQPPPKPETKEENEMPERVEVVK